MIISFRHYITFFLQKEEKKLKTFPQKEKEKSHTPYSMMK